MKNALIVVDLQNDFLQEGALEIKRGNEIIHPINQIMEKFDWILASKDWHPDSHICFAQTWNKEVGEEVEVNGVKQKLWPVHCVENTFGSEHPENFNSDQVHHTFFKGNAKNVDSYSIFFDQHKNPATPIATFLTVHQITDLYFVGLSTEYCVKQSVLDALSLGYKSTVLKDCCRSIDSKEEKEACDLMIKKGAQIIHSSTIQTELSLT